MDSDMDLRLLGASVDEFWETILPRVNDLDKNVNFVVQYCHILEAVCVLNTISFVALAFTVYHLARKVDNVRQN